MGDNMRLVQSGGVEDSVHPADASPQARAIKDRANLAGERRCTNIDTNDLVLQILQSADQRFTKVPSTSCDQNLHACVVTSFFARTDGVVNSRLVSEKPLIWRLASRLLHKWPASLSRQRLSAGG